MIIRTIRSNLLVLAGFGFGILYWLVEAAVHTIILQQDPFLSALFPTEADELWMRSLTSILFVSMGGLAQLAIHRQRLVKRILLKNESKFREIAEDTPILICRFLPGGEITYVNEAYGKHFAKTPEDLVGTSFLSLIPEADRKGVMARISALTVESPMQSHEHRVITPDGAIRWQRWTNRAMFDDQGEAVAIQSIGEDITERKLVEEALRHERNFAESLIETAQAIVLVLDIEGRIVRFNRYMEELSGFRLQDVKDKDWFETFLPQGDWGPTRDVFRKAVNDIHTQGHVNPILTQDGELREIEWYDKTLKDADGGVVGVLAIGQDITDRKRAEEALHESEERFRHLFENAPIGIYRTTPDGQILMANPAILNMLGYSSFEELAQRNLEMEGYHPSYLRDEFKRKIEGSGQVHALECDWTRQDGTTVNVREHAQAIRDEDGSTLYYEGTAEDITENKQVQEKLRGSEELLTEMGRIARIGGWEHDCITGEASWTRGTYEIIELESGTPPGLDEHLDFYPPEDRAILEKAYNRAMETEEPFDLELRCFTAKGRPMWASVIGRPVFEDGKCIKMQGTLQDISERKRAEEQLASAKTFLDTVVDMSPFAMWVSDPTGTIIRTNRSLRETLQLTDEEITGQYNVFADDNLKTQGLMDRVRNVFGKHEPTRFSMQWMAAKAGNTAFDSARNMYIDVSMFPILDAEGNLRNVVCQWVDITEQRQAEQDLRDSEERYRSLVNNIDLGICLIDVDHRIVMANDKLLELLGQPAHELIGHPCFTKLEKRDAICLHCPGVQAMETGKPAEVETKGVRPDGYPLNCRLQAFPVFDADGTTTGFIEVIEDISARVQAEKAMIDLRNRREELEKIVNRSPAVAFLWRAEEGWPVAYVSENVAQFGYSPADFHDRPTLFGEMIHPDDLERVGKEVQQFNLESSEQFEQMYRFIAATGEARWVDDHTWVRRDSDGKITHYEGIVLDITEGKRAEEALRESEEKYRTFFDNSVDAMLMIEDRQFVDCNTATLAMLGYDSKDELIHTHPSELSPDIQPDGRGSQEKANEMMKIAVDEGSHFFEWNHKRKDGCIFPVEVSLTAIRVKNKPMLHAVWRDVTERKRAEKALRESEERFRLLFENAPLGYQSLDANGRFIEVNEKWCKVLGYTKEEVRGRNFSEFIHPDFKEHFKVSFPKFKNLGFILGVEFEMIKKDGKTIIVSFDGKIGHEDDGSFKQTHCVLHDITKRKLAEQKLARYQDHLEELVEQRTSELKESQAKLRQSEHLASLGTLATGIAHEINNPIVAILLAAQSALAAHDEARKQESALQEISKHAKRCGGIIRNVLKFARQGTSDKKPVDLNETIQQVVHLTRPHAEENGATIAENLAEGLPRISANPAEMGQLLINLIQNAIESGARDIAVHTSQVANFIHISVKDNGCGIPAILKGRVFDPFYSTRHSEGGTGLGLSIVHGIVEDHGGKIEIVDDGSVGTTFLIELPIHFETSGDDDVKNTDR